VEALAVAAVISDHSVELRLHVRVGQHVLTSLSAWHNGRTVNELRSGNTGIASGAHGDGT